MRGTKRSTTCWRHRGVAGRYRGVEGWRRRGERAHVAGGQMLIPVWLDPQEAAEIGQANSRSGVRKLLKDGHMCVEPVASPLDPSLTSFFLLRPIRHHIPCIHLAHVIRSFLLPTHLVPPTASSSRPPSTREPEPGSCTPPSDWADTPVPVSERVPPRPECPPRCNGSDECESSDDC